MRKVLLLVIAVFAAFASFSQISVTATAGTTGPTAYTTLSGAFAAINAGTHQGAITIAVTANTTETAACVLNSSGAGSASYTSVLIQPTADGVSISGPTVTGRGLIELNGADNVTIDGDNPNTGGTNRNLSIVNTAATSVTYTSVIRLVTSSLITSADNNIIRNCIVTGSGTSFNAGGNTSFTTTQAGTVGIFAGAGGSTAAATTAPSAISANTTQSASGQTFLGLTISNNQVGSCGKGIVVMGAATTVVPVLTIMDNTIGNSTAGATNQVYWRGIIAQGFGAGTISGNTIYVEGYSGSTSAPYGIAAIDLGSLTSNTTAVTGTSLVIEKNIIARVKQNNTGGYPALGINVQAGNDIIVRNNFIYGINNIGNASFSSTYGAQGIRIATGNNIKVYHNTVALSGSDAGTGNLTSCISFVGTSTANCDVRNNIFSNVGTSASSSSAFVNVYFGSAPTAGMALTINNNAYYTGSTAGLNAIGQNGTTYGSGVYTSANFNAATTGPATNFRALTSVSTATNDNASITSTSAAPFVSATNLHINTGTTPTLLESSGASVGVSTDIDGQTRPGPTTVNGGGTAPDLGADEFDGAPVVLNPCVAPTNQPTALILTPTATSIGGSFTASSPAADNYLVIATTGAAPSNPVDGVIYTPGTTALGGTIISIGTTTSFSATGLTANTAYSFYVFAFSTVCTGGPVYNVTSPLNGNSTTCVVVPASVVTSNITTSSFTLSWASSLGGGAATVTYTVDVATDNAFASPVAGSPFTVNDPTVSQNISGLNSSTIYYYRVKANGSCNSNYSTTASVATACGAVSTFPYTESFESISAAGSLPACWGASDLNGTSGKCRTFTASATGTNSALVARTGNKFVAANWSPSATQAWFYAAPVSLTSGQTYRASIYYKTDGVSWTDAGLYYGTAATPASMTNTIVSISSAAATSYTLIQGDFTAPSTGVFYIGIRAYNSTSSPNYISFDDFSLDVLNTCTGTPTAGTIPSTALLCSGGSSGISLSVSGYSTGVGGISFQWEESDDNGVGDAWADAVGGSGATTATYTSPVLSSSIYYRCKVTCSGSGLFAYTNVSAVTVGSCEHEVTRNTGITYNSIASTGTGVNSWSGTSLFTDDNKSNLINIGFSFPYKGQTFTQLSISTNGYISLGSISGAGYQNNLNGSTFYPNIIAPFWDDLVAQGNTGVAADLQNYIKTSLTGTTPNQVFTIEWIGMEQYSYPGPNLNFQTKLYENGNIEFVYGTMELFNGSTPTVATTFPTAYSYSVGIAGPSTASGLIKSMALLGENVVAFGSTDATTLAISPECNSSYLFTPGAYSGSTSTPAAAPPVNDESGAAITLVVNPSPCVSLCGTYYTTKNATGSPEPSSCASAPDDDVWFKFTATTSSQIISVKGATGFDAVVSLYDAGLNAVGSFGCVDATTGNATALGQTETISATGLNAGQEYYVRVSHKGTGSGSASGFSICVSEVVPPPVNDDITGAITLTPGSTCSTTAGTTLNATASAQTVCGGTADDDVWYQWTVASPNDVLTVQSNAGFNAHVEVFSSSDNTANGTLTTLGCTNATSTAGVETVNASSFSPAVVVGNTYFVRVYHSASGTGTGSFTICVISQPTWAGTSSTDWNDPNNWSPAALPTSVTNAFIPNVTNKPIIGSGVGSVRNISISTGSSLTVNGTGKLQVAGTITSNALLDATAGAIELNGATAQTLGGGVFTGNVKNLIVGNTNGLTLTGTLPVTGSVSFSVSNAALASAGYLTLKSSATGTAYIADLTNAGANTGNTITGSVKVERYIAGSGSAFPVSGNSKRGFRFIGHPFSASIGLNEINGASEFSITGASGSSNGFQTSGSNNPSAFWYDPTVATAGSNTTVGAGSGASADAGWKAFTNTNGVGANAWGVGQGIRFLFRGDQTQGLNTNADYTMNPATASMTGTVNMGPVTLNLASNNANAKGFNVLANPLPAPVDLSLTTSRTNMGANFWVFDPSIGSRGGYSAAKPFASSYVLPLGGAFVAEVTTVGSASSLTFPEAAKATTPTDNLFRNFSQDSYIQLKLESANMDWGELNFNLGKKYKAATEYVDGAKFINSDVNFYSITSDDNRLSLDYRQLAEGDVIPLGLQTNLARSFTIRAVDVNLIAGEQLYLVDKFLNTETKLETGMVYNFVTTSDAASQGEARFAISRKQGLLPVVAPTFSIKLSPNPARDMVTVSFTNEVAANTIINITNAEGKIVSSTNAGNVQSGISSINVKRLAKGTYYVTLSNGMAKKTEKLIIE